MNEILQGIKVLDFTHVASGPMCTMLLGDGWISWRKTISSAARWKPTTMWSPHHKRNMTRPLYQSTILITEKLKCRLSG